MKNWVQSSKLKYCKKEEKFRMQGQNWLGYSAMPPIASNQHTGISWTPTREPNCVYTTQSTG